MFSITIWPRSGAGDVDQTMEDFTEDSVMILPDATLRGTDSIRAAFADSYGGLFKSGTYEFTMDRFEVSGGRRLRPLAFR